MVSSILFFAAIASIASIVDAHMIMKQPIPYGRGTINNSPLANDGSDYPCKNIFEMTDPTNDVNHLVPGVANTLSFTGSAVHGGGSCQVALTTDLKPTKSSKWMVIKSIENGCPANVGGNLPADPSGNGASTFQYTVPAGFPAGDYTIAWVWFNKIGNREMYMNCGRASIANSKKRYALPAPKIEHRAADYPDILKAQLKIFPNCINETFSVTYPNPGPDVQVVPGGQMQKPFDCASGAPLSGGSNSSPNPAPVASSAGADSPTASSVASAGSGNPVATSADGAAPTDGFATGGANPPAQATGTRGGGRPAPSGNPGVFASGAASQSAQPTAADPNAQATATATVSPVPAAPSSAPNNGNGPSTPSVPSNGASTQGSQCSEEGAWACSSDGKSFQRCASGIWSAPMQVAAGTTCTPGTSMNLSMKVVSGSLHKRDSISHQHHKRVLGVPS